MKRGKDMRRRELLGLATGMVVLPSLAAAQSPKAARVGFLSTNLSADGGRTDAFRQRLRELGYVEGHNLVIEYRDAEGKPERFPVLAAELAGLKPDVMVTAGGTAAVQAAKKATATLPIVFVGVGDPVQEGLVASLARPGGNVTGFSLVAPESISKWLELLKQVVPGADLVGVLYNPDPMPESARTARLREVELSARALGLRVQLFEAGGPEEFEPAFSEVSNSGAGALLILSTPVFQIAQQRLADLAAKYRLPAVYQFREFVEAGGLMSYGPNSRELFQRAAEKVGKTPQGATPAELPVEQPTRFHLVLNLKTAKALGLTVPQSLLARADEVIE